MRNKGEKNYIRCHLIGFVKACYDEREESIT